jgi:DNA-binding NtrC family response regulator
MVTIRVGSTIEDAVKEMIAQTLTWTNNNRQRTAAILGITRRTLYNKISKYKL